MRRLTALLCDDDDDLPDTRYPQVLQSPPVHADAAVCAIRCPAGFGWATKLVRDGIVEEACAGGRCGGGGQGGSSSTAAVMAGRCGWSDYRRPDGVEYNKTFYTSDGHGLHFGDRDWQDLRSGGGDWD